MSPITHELSQPIFRESFSLDQSQPINGFCAQKGCNSERRSSTRWERVPERKGPVAAATQRRPGMVALAASAGPGWRRHPPGVESRRSPVHLDVRGFNSTFAGLKRRDSSLIVESKTRTSSFTGAHAAPGPGEVHGPNRSAAPHPLAQRRTPGAGRSAARRRTPGAATRPNHPDSSNARGDRPLLPAANPVSGTAHKRGWGSTELLPHPNRVGNSTAAPCTHPSGATQGEVSNGERAPSGPRGPRYAAPGFA